MEQKPLEFLIIEDEPEHLEILEHRLTESGKPFHSVCFPNAELALEHLLQEAGKEPEDAALPDIIVLDLYLPGKDGFEVLKELKAHPQLKDIPVIVNSASTQKKDIVESYRKGGTFFMNKDWDETILQEAIHHLRFTR